MTLKAPEGMPEYLREMIENDTLKDQPKEFVERLIKWSDRIARGDIPPQVKEMYAVTSEVGRKNFEIARAANLLCDRVEEYVVREWEESQKQAKLPAPKMRTESMWEKECAISFGKTDVRSADLWTGYGCRLPSVADSGFLKEISKLFDLVARGGETKAH